MSSEVLRENDVVRVSWRIEGMSQFAGKLARVKEPYLQTASWVLVANDGTEIIVPRDDLALVYRAPRPGQTVHIPADAPVASLLRGKDVAAVEPSLTRVDHWMVSTPGITGTVHIGFLEFDPEAGWTESAKTGIPISGEEIKENPVKEQMLPASKVIEVARSFARKHDWCDVIEDEVFPALGIVPPPPRKIRFVVEVDENTYFEEGDGHDSADFENWDDDDKVGVLADVINSMNFTEQTDAFISAEFVNKE